MQRTQQNSATFLVVYFNYYFCSVVSASCRELIEMEANYVGMLQEYARSIGKEVNYENIASVGPDHIKT